MLVPTFVANNSLAWCVTLVLLSAFLHDCMYNVLGGVHKLRLQDLAFFDHLPPSVYIFYVIHVY